MTHDPRGTRYPEMASSYMKVLVGRDYVEVALQWKPDHSRYEIEVKFPDRSVVLWTSEESDRTDPAVVRLASDVNSAICGGMISCQSLDQCKRVLTYDWTGVYQTCDLKHLRYWR